jgi:hypothetical protein
MANDKKYFEVRVETMLPATLTYRILAENAEQAAGMINNIAPITVKYKLIGKKDIKLNVYNFGCTILLYMKNFFK